MAKPSDPKTVELNSIRDTVESVWVAIVLAFVLRAFMVEAFVIPTGSMAPRLMGEHQRLVCPSCGFGYAFGLPREGSLLNPAKKHPAPEAQCPSCHAPFDHLYPDNDTAPRAAFVESGDRVLVLKYLYHFRGPRPWEVVVFKNPQDNRQNYIKRLIGLPGEMIEIVHGDIFHRSAEDRNGDRVIDEADFPEDPAGQAWRIRGKPPRAQHAMWQVVFDNDYRPSDDWILRGDPPRWGPHSGQAWDLSGDNGRVFTFPGGAPGAIRFEADDATFYPRYGYNAPREEAGRYDQTTDICTDLRLRFTWFPAAADASVAAMLTSFEHEFRGDIAADGSARLLHRKAGRPDWDDVWGERKIPPLDTGRGHTIAMVHVDFAVQLWVDDRLVIESSREEYGEGYAWLKARMSNVDRQPVPGPGLWIQARGGPSELRHVQVHRDVFYTQAGLDAIPARTGGPSYRRAMSFLAGRAFEGDRPPGWGTMGNPIVLRKFLDQPDRDEFFMLGDNSPQSLDGRAWTRTAPTLHDDYRLGTVPRYNLIGRALFVYWPAGFRVPVLNRVPIIPNVGRMRLIR